MILHPRVFKKKESWCATKKKETDRRNLPLVPFIVQMSNCQQVSSWKEKSNIIPTSVIIEKYSFLCAHIKSATLSVFFTRKTQTSYTTTCVANPFLPNNNLPFSSKAKRHQTSKTILLSNPPHTKTYLDVVAFLQECKRQSGHTFWGKCGRGNCFLQCGSMVVL